MVNLHSQYKILNSTIHFSIIITTNNRMEDLKYSLQKVELFIDRDDVECLICDDGSVDGTFEFIKKNYPSIKLIKNSKKMGLIYSRNRLMELAIGKYAISLDDDLNFLTPNPLECIAEFFESHPKCAVQSFRIYWDKIEPLATETQENSYRVINYAGGAHAFRMDAWFMIPNYPSWFKFYGEENYASFHLFLNEWEIYYQPFVLAHHRVDLKARKGDKDYITRQRRSLRSGWYLYLIFYPVKYIPKAIIYSMFIQFKKGIKTRNWKLFIALLLAILDVFWNLLRMLKEDSRLSQSEYLDYFRLPSVPLYWNPKI